MIGLRVNTQQLLHRVNVNIYSYNLNRRKYY